MRADAESAADDSVLRSGLKASEYATELLQIAAEIGNRQTQLSRIGTPAMTQSKIETRLKSVLAPRVHRRGVTSLEALFAAMIALLSAAGIGSLQVGEKPAQGPRSSEEATEAMTRLKQLALGTLLYASDYDDDLPYPQSTASMKGVIGPYVKSNSLFDSPTPGGRFNFNLSIGGVRMIDFEKPAETPMWVERLTEKESRPGVAFVDGHVKLVNNLDPTIEKALKWKFPRRKGMKPLPSGYLINPGN
jgi:prepilin-type processing-associated H-X9-DG protein